MVAEKVQNSTFTAAAVGGITTIAVWALKEWGKVDVTAEVAGALTAVLMALFTHFVPDDKQP